MMCIISRNIEPATEAAIVTHKLVSEPRDYGNRADDIWMMMLHEASIPFTLDELLGYARFFGARVGRSR